MQKNYTIYKPNAKKSGSASNWQLSEKTDDKGKVTHLFFLEMANQLPEDVNGNARFDWRGGKITVCLNIVDLSEMLLVLTGKKDAVGTKGSLYHQKDDTNKMISLNWSKDHESYYLRISQKNQNSLSECRHSITLAEAEIIRIFIEESIFLMI